jgi:hypothetical protein
MACGNGDDPAEEPAFPTSAPPQVLDQWKRDRYFPVQYVLDSNVILVTSLRRLEREDLQQEAVILVEGYAAAQKGPLLREYSVLIVDDQDREYVSPENLTFDVDLDREQPFARAVTVPIDINMTGVRFRPVDGQYETKTYLIELGVADIPYTSSVEIYR